MRLNIGYLFNFLILLEEILKCETWAETLFFSFFFFFLDLSNLKKKKKNEIKLQKNLPSYQQNQPRIWLALSGKDERAAMETYPSRPHLCTEQ